MYKERLPNKFGILRVVTTPDSLSVKEQVVAFHVNLGYKGISGSY